VEALCRWDRPSRPKEPTKEVVVIPRTPAGPSLNSDDVPEAGFAGRSFRRTQVSQKHRPSCFQTVVEGNEENSEWPCSHDDELLPEADKQLEVQWQCASCTFLNDALMSVCEMCDRHRTRSARGTAVTPEAQAVASSDKKEGNAPPSEKAFVGRKWPSLQQSLCQATEKSWEFCEQSSVASSMVDVARLADVDASCKDAAVTLEAAAPAAVSAAELFDIMSDSGSHAAAPAEDCSPELYDIMSNTGPLTADKERTDTSSMASWWHLDASSEVSKVDGQGKCASVASSWVDVGNLADFEGHPEQDPKIKIANGATSWSALVSEAGSAGRIKAPSCSGVPVPPLTRCQAPRKKAPAPEVEDEDFDDQDGRGRGRASRQYRRRR